MTQHEPIFFSPPPSRWDRRLFKGGGDGGGGGGSSEEKKAPDPAIVVAANRQTEVGAEMAGIARDELAWNKAQWEQMRPQLEKLTQQQIDLGDLAAGQALHAWRRYEQKYLPLEDQYLKRVENTALPREDAYINRLSRVGSTADQERAAALAGGEVAQAVDEQRGASLREMASMGIRPDSGRLAEADRVTGLQKAAMVASAQNMARDQQHERGIAASGEAANVARGGALADVANFGRGLPATSLAANATGLGGYRAGFGSQVDATQARNSGVTSALPWYGGATSAYGQSANTLLGQYQGGLQSKQIDMQGEQFKAQQSSARSQAIGSAIGMGVGVIGAVVF